MTLLRLLVIGLASTGFALLVAHTAVAEGQGKGGKGGAAAVGIATILLVDDPDNPVDDILAEISGGGFLGGDFVEVSLDGVAIDHVERSAEMLYATIPGTTLAGDHEIRVRTGDDNKQSATATIRLGGQMRVSCISWFVSGPNDEHLHTEVHVEDENGDAVIGATVTWEAGNVNGVYQMNVSPTADNDGHASELTTCPVDETTGEALVSGSGVTGWFCCIGAGKWDNEVPPGKRACPAGDYTARILDVTAPLSTNMVWDDVNSELEASTQLLDPKFP
jgi:hypothetical protein